jgi:hypothetical protein
MAKVTQETITTQDSRSDASERPLPQRNATGFQTIEYVAYFFFGALEILLAFRMILKLLGASLSSGFVKGVYDFSGIFTAPFEGIFHTSTTQGLDATSVLEPSTLVAILVYAVVAWGVVMLIRLLSGKKQED